MAGLLYLFIGMINYLFLQQEMVRYGFSISNNCAEVVANRLQGNQLTTDISDMLAKLSSGDLSLVEPKRTTGQLVNVVRVSSF